jgi:hypothetical protein
MMLEAKTSGNRKVKQVFPPGQVLVQGGELPGHGNRGAHVVRGQHEVMAHDRGGAGVEPGEGREHTQEGRLSGTVRAQDGKDHAARHVEIDAVDGAHSSERLDQAAGGNGGRSSQGGAGHLPCR